MEKKVNLILKVPESLKKASQERAKSMGLSTSAWIRLVLMDQLEDSTKTQAVNVKSWIEK